MRSSLLPNPNFTLDFVLAEFKIIPVGVELWISSFINPGALIVLGLTGLFSLLLSWLGYTFAIRRLSLSALGFLGFSLMLAIVNSVSEAFAYEAFWHQVQVREISWFGLCCAGVALGAGCGRMQQSAAPVITLLIAGILSLVCAGSTVVTMTGTWISREHAWNSGAAPEPGIADIESKWVRDSWEKLADFRGTDLRK
ncbi:MAG: hypothetical protein PHN51_06980 [Candidatus Nanopelagicales bacterium]|nr:hypothetical protein [Candidatus Nanopelagicales bacterium]